MPYSCLMQKQEQQLELPLLYLLSTLSVYTNFLVILGYLRFYHCTLIHIQSCSKNNPHQLSR